MVTDEIQQISRADSIISHYPRLGHDDNPDGIDPKGCEELLTEWFGNQVILLASGRSGLNLYLNAKGFRPYQHTLQ
ncbi:hypothetical protein M1N23_03600, partial [Dehalococcoidia bacterium]|nr:hypothetical protein [Dehalococcoidia bacterium]